MTGRLRELLLWAGAALGLLAVAAGLAVAFLGFSFLVFRSGSMSPEIPTGGLALARTVPAAELRPGDVVSVMTSTDQRVTHRVVSTALRGDTASLVLQGDANATPDEEIYQVTSAERVVASVPYGGYVLAHALTPPGLLAVGTLSLMLLIVAWGPATESPARPERRRGGARRRQRARRRTNPVVAAAVVLALAGGSVAAGRVSGTLAFFTDAGTARTPASTSNPYFTCDAAVRGVANPFLYWRLDETALSLGVAVDSSNNGRPGSYQGLNLTNLGQARACARDTGSAVTLNGSSQYVGAGTTTNAVAGPNTFTASMWFQTTTNRGGKLFGFGNARTGSSGNYDRHVYMTNAGTLVFGVYPGSVQTVTSPAAYNDGQWHQVVASLSAAGMRLFVDGALVASRTGVTTGEGYNGYWRVGYDNLGGWVTIPTSSYFAGTVDDFAVHTTALSEAQVAAMNAAGR